MSNEVSIKDALVNLTQALQIMSNSVVWSNPSMYETVQSKLKAATESYREIMIGNIEK